MAPITIINPVTFIDSFISTFLFLLLLFVKMLLIKRIDRCLTNLIINCNGASMVIKTSEHSDAYAYVMTSNGLNKQPKDSPNYPMVKSFMWSMIRTNCSKGYRKSVIVVNCLKFSIYYKVNCKRCLYHIQCDKHPKHHKLCGCLFHIVI